MRDSPAIVIIQTLQDAGAKVAAFDPKGEEQARKVLSDVEYPDGADAAVDGADAAVIVTEWDAFRALDLGRIALMLASKVLVDLRNIYQREAVEAAGLPYHAVGR